MFTRVACRLPIYREINQMADKDVTDQLLAAMQPGASPGKLLVIRGTASRYLGVSPPKQNVELLKLGRHRGIIDYAPEELMVKVRCGTLLSELNAVLKGQGQQLPFEASYGKKTGTLGGAVSVAQDGPALPWRGALRDAVLGVSLISGNGQLLRFGGQVMKNVAGFDVSRLCVGALGTFGPLLDVSLKLLPSPEQTAYRSFEMTQEYAIEWMIRHQAKPWPFAGLAWTDNNLQVRYAGHASWVQLALDTLGGDTGDENWWQSIHQPHWAPLPATPPNCIADVPPGTHAHPDTWLLDWGGSRRYFAQKHQYEVSEWAKSQHGTSRLCPPLSLAFGGRRGAIQADLKRVFDPNMRINPHVSVQLKEPELLDEGGSPPN